MKGRVAAGILRMPYDELRKGERLDAALAAPHVTSARRIIQLAERAGESRSVHSSFANSRLRAVLPFRRPTCPNCRHSLYVACTQYTVRRGEFWYFRCPSCGRRYWSADGRAHPVNPKGGNWRMLKGRPRCKRCRLECSRKARHYWECPKCRRRYRSVRGRAVPTVPGGRAIVTLPFLPTRRCPHCGNTRVGIRARPHPPKVRYYYFRCSSCGKNSRFDKNVGGLVPLEPREKPARARHAGSHNRGTHS
jgi:tRNA(Ile2) C34 agmatinyltransferase TiaS